MADFFCVYFLVVSLSDDLGTGVIYTGVFLIFMFALLFIFPYIKIRKGYKSLLEMYNNNTIIKISFAENIIFETSRGIRTLEYSEIVKFTDDKSCFVIYTSFDVGYIILKNSFVKGSSEDFKEFIQSKLS